MLVAQHVLQHLLGRDGCRQSGARCAGVVPSAQDLPAGLRLTLHAHMLLLAGLLAQRQPRQSQQPLRCEAWAPHCCGWWAPVLRVLRRCCSQRRCCCWCLTCCWQGCCRQRGRGLLQLRCIAAHQGVLRGSAATAACAAAAPLIPWAGSSPVRASAWLLAALTALAASLQDTAAVSSGKATDRLSAAAPSDRPTPACMEPVAGLEHAVDVVNQRLDGAHHLNCAQAAAAVGVWDSSSSQPGRQRVEPLGADRPHSR